MNVQSAEKEKQDTRGIKLPMKSPGSKEKKQNEMALIEAQLKEYHDSSIRAIETDFNTSVSALNDITEKLTGIESSLNQLLSQHEDITKATTKSNEDLSKNITQLRNDFEKNHADAMKKRESLKKMAIEAINNENSKIVKTTAEGFQYNAIVGLAAALDSVQSLIV